MYRVSIELYKHEWKFGKTRNAVGTRAAGKCYHSFFEFSQTFTSVCITRQKYRVHVFYFFQKTTRRQKGKQLVIFDYQNVNSLYSRHHYVNSARQFCVSIDLYKHDFQPISARAFLGLFSNVLYCHVLSLLVMVQKTEDNSIYETYRLQSFITAKNL